MLGYSSIVMSKQDEAATFCCFEIIGCLLKKAKDYTPIVAVSKFDCYVAIKVQQSCSSKQTLWKVGN